jgi:hypothetical protein
VLVIISALLRITADQSFANLGLLISSLASGIFVVFGIYFININRLTAYRMFNLAVLILIFLNQFFLFFEEQLSAITRLAISIVIWGVLHNLIYKETSCSNKI